MKKSEEKVIEHSIGLMEAMTNWTPTCNENSKFLIVAIGRGPDEIKIAYDKQFQPATNVDITDEFMDNIRMSAFVQCLGFCLQYFTQGRLVAIVTSWDKAREEEG